jgi:hypothetical protein
MATLVSPGVDVQIYNESFYATAGTGTVPLVVFASAANKPISASDSTIAPYSVPSRAGELFLATSQRELIQQFGTPTFKTVQGTPLHGDELNEYGLLAAYQYLGISNRCYVVRADIDTAQLESSTSAPVGAPQAGTFWFDVGETSFGVFQSNGNPNAGVAWLTQPVLVAGSANTTNGEPSTGFGADGDFAVVVSVSDNLLYEKLAGAWFLVGSTAWKANYPTKVQGSTNPAPILTTDTIVITVYDSVGAPTATTISFSATTGTLPEIVTEINNAAIPNVTASVTTGTALLIAEIAGGKITVQNGAGTPLATLGIVPNTYNGVSLKQTSNAQYPANSVAGDVWIKGTVPNKGADWSVKYWSSAGQWIEVAAPFYPYDSIAADGDAGKDAAALLAFGVPTVGTIYVGYDDGVASGGTPGTQQIRRWNGTMFENLVYEASTVPPTSAPSEGTLWYNSDLRVDIMYGDGTTWMGYKHKFQTTDPNGVIISGSKPLVQSTGSALVDNDLWLDSSDLENYPLLYRYSTTTGRWTLIDNTDQTSPFGVVFADARADSGPTYSGAQSGYAFNSELPADMVKSDYLLPDAPDPRTYPDGMLLFNTRYGTYNVKQWEPNYFALGGYDANTDYTEETYRIGTAGPVFPALTDAGVWLTASGNGTNGAPLMGRKAQRAMIVRAMGATISENENLRSDLVYYNLIAAPGYPEMIDEMVVLNTDQKEVSFIVADTPARLRPTGTDITAWATNANGASSNGEDGLTTSSDYVGVYYPWGLSTDLSGNEVMVPPSSVALCTMAYNDQVAYPWFAPAGFTRGLVQNATTVGYLTSEGEFKPVLLNQGQKDVLYTNKINPIVFIPNRGLVVNGQKTRAPLDSAMDRINVARLVNYLKYQLSNITQPFLFEPNDEQTRESARVTVERFLEGLVGLRALEDYGVQCDLNNNTPERRDRNELWIDVAIIPTKAVEFIYIPVRILNSGDSIA